MFRMSGVFAEFERSMIREQVMADLSRAKAEGTQLGRRRLEDNDAAKAAAIGAARIKGVRIRRMPGSSAPTAADARDTTVEGVSDIPETAPNWARPTYEPSKRKLTWPSGAVATFSSEGPERLRGLNHDAAWADELVNLLALCIGVKFKS
jgi:hypothetical protein